MCYKERDSNYMRFFSEYIIINWPFFAITHELRFQLTRSCIWFPTMTKGSWINIEPFKNKRWHRGIGSASDENAEYHCYSFPVIDKSIKAGETASLTGNIFARIFSLYHFSWRAKGFQVKPLRSICHKIYIKKNRMPTTTNLQLFSSRPWL